MGTVELAGQATFQPLDLVYDTVTDRLYVTHWTLEGEADPASSGALLTIDVSSMQVVDSLPLTAPNQLELQPDARRGYVTSGLNRARLTVVDLQAFAEMARIDLGIDGVMDLVGDQRSRLWAITSDWSLAMIDTETMDVTEVASHAGKIEGPASVMAIDTELELLFAPAGEDNGELVVFSFDGQLVDRVNLNFIPDAVTVDSRRHLVYVSGEGLNSVPGKGPDTRIAIYDADERTLVREESLFLPIADIVIDAARVVLYASLSLSGEVVMLDAQTLAETARERTGKGPSRMTLDPGRGRLFVANAGSDSITVIGPS